VIKDNGILVVTPDVKDHKYCYLGLGGYIPMGSQYSLEGVKVSNPTKPTPDMTLNAIMIAADCGFKTSDVPSKQPACSFSLPLPDLNGMGPLRGIPSGGVDVSGTYQPKNVAKYPMIQVISYAVDPANADKVILRSSSPGSYPSWQPFLGAGSTSGTGAQIENLHIFAEPSKAVSDHHAEKAFKKMVEMVHPKIADLRIKRKSMTSAPAPDNPTYINGIAPDEENSLQERNLVLNTATAIPSGGIQIVNCMNLIIQ
jgi:hypothetical protein